MKNYILNAQTLRLRNENNTDVYLTTCDLTGEFAMCYECTATDEEGDEFHCDINQHDFADLINGDYEG